MDYQTNGLSLSLSLDFFSCPYFFSIYDWFDKYFFELHIVCAFIPYFGSSRYQGDRFI